MVNDTILNTYETEKVCVYKNETYSVRDNGAIMRHPKKEGKKRPYDNKWTFGTPDMETGYMLFRGERVHRIVATAFHGEAPSKEHVVDHIDTNRRNNRADNLRWLSKLENILNNEITRSKIEYICGSIENFLRNPSLLQNHTEDKNFEWMKTVTKEEGANSLANINQWLKNANKQKTDMEDKGNIGEWIYKNTPQLNHKKSDVQPSSIENPKTVKAYLNQILEEYPKGKTEEEIKEEEKEQQDLEDQIKKLKKDRQQREEAQRRMKKEEEERLKPILIQSLTPNCMQINWKTPMKFICCPQDNYGEYPLETYSKNLRIGEIYAKNERNESKVEKYILDDDKSRLWVIVYLGKFGIAEITFKDGIFYHDYIKRFDFFESCIQWITTELQGKEWNDENGIDWLKFD